MKNSLTIFWAHKKVQEVLKYVSFPLHKNRNSYDEAINIKVKINWKQPERMIANGCTPVCVNWPFGNHLSLDKQFF